MQPLNDPIEAVDACVANLPRTFLFRKLNSRKREIVFPGKDSLRQPRMDMEVSFKARVASFGVYHPYCRIFFYPSKFFWHPRPYKFALY
jgi:hypothetical protein